jgi:ribosomal protein S18 acetylase RimI-like enzyme
MIIREFSERFSERDIDEITALMKSLCSMKGQKFDEERWRASLEKQMKEDANSGVFVAFDKKTNQVIGMAYCSVKTDSDKGFRFGYVSNLIVKEEQRRTGIGELLVRNVIDFFRRNHIQSIRLALKTNIDGAAQTLFQKLGFQELFKVYELKI